MKPTRHASRRRERGTQVAELALVLPLLAFLALGISEGAAFVRVHQVLNNAAREGARLSAQQQFFGNPTATIQQATSQYACNNGVKIGSGYGATCPASTIPCSAIAGVEPITPVQNATITLPGSIAVPASTVKVSCTYTLKYVPSLSKMLSGGGGVGAKVTLGGTAEFQNFWAPAP